MQKNLNNVISFEQADCSIPFHEGMEAKEYKGVKLIINDRKSKTTLPQVNLKLVTGVMDGKVVAFFQGESIVEKGDVLISEEA